MNSYKQLKKKFERISHLHYIQRIMMWDEAVMMPEGAGEARAHAMATLSSTTQKLLISKKTKTLIDAAKENHNLSFWDEANLKWMEKRHLSAACIPIKLTEELTKDSIGCEQAWRKFRAQNNWRDFLPYFKRVFELIKEVADRKSQALQLDPYDALLDEYASGFNQANIDPVFLKLKQSIPQLVKDIIKKQEANRILTPIGPFSIEKQKNLGIEVMQALQFDFQYGRLDVSHHPFCSGDSEDVRITTRYREDEFLSSLIGICHETGHGLYEQGLPKKWLTQPVGKVENMAMHESQSLLIEMQVCRSLEFFEYLVPLVEKTFGKQAAITSDNLFKQVTTVKQSLIRVDADEVTYPLHIILRYELEKSLFKGDITIQDLPAHWNELMMQYLDISTENNYKDGVMQDVHWPSGAFGYFPAYTLGRLIAAQLFAKFNNIHSEFLNEVRKGNFLTLINWLKENVYDHASSLSTNDLLMKVTGETLNSEYFIQHIKRRY